VLANAKAETKVKKKQKALKNRKRVELGDQGSQDMFDNIGVY